LISEINMPVSPEQSKRVGNVDVLCEGGKNEESGLHFEVSKELETLGGSNLGDRQDKSTWEKTREQ